IRRVPAPRPPPACPGRRTAPPGRCDWRGGAAGGSSSCLSAAAEARTGRPANNYETVLSGTLWIVRTGTSPRTSACGRGSVSPPYQARRIMASDVGGRPLAQRRGQPVDAAPVLLLAVGRQPLLALGLGEAQQRVAPPGV